jgi:hypothetical protein
MQSAPLSLDVVMRRLSPADHAARASGVVTREPAQARDPITVLRNAHHAAARLLASGKSDSYAAAQLGWSPERVRAMRGSPAFQELLALYAEQRDIAVMDLSMQMELLARDTLAELHERLLDPEKAAAISEPALLEMFKTAADRAGYGPTAKTVNAHYVVPAEADRLRAVLEGSAERVVVTEDVRSALLRTDVPQAHDALLREKAPNEEGE